MAVMCGAICRHITAIFDELSLTVHSTTTQPHPHFNVDHKIRVIASSDKLINYPRNKLR